LSPDPRDPDEIFFDDIPTPVTRYPYIVVTLGPILRGLLIDPSRRLFANDNRLFLIHIKSLCIRLMQRTS
jgi:hypothetical protein